MHLFGPSREEIWRKLAAEVGGDYIDGGFWKRDRIEAEHGGWTVILDSYFNAAAKAEYTRLRARFANPDGFRFTIYRRGLFSEIAKTLGMQDVEVGYPEFDRDFIIKGNDEKKLRALFGNALIRSLIAAQPRIHLTVQQGREHQRPEHPAGSDELSFTTVGIIKDLARLKQLFSLFAETLDQLCSLRSAGA